MAGQIWHHLQLIDKLKSYRYDYCRLCSKLVLGSRSYKCEEHYCGFLIHEPCPETTDRKREIEATHNLRSTHHLISMKEAEKNGDEKKVVVCSLCDEPVSSLLMSCNNDNINNNGPTFYYKCCFPNCTFLIHQPCAQLPYETPKHPLHFSDHNLYLQEPTETQNHCGACFKVFSKRFYYDCGYYDYMLDIKCDSRWRASVDKCNKHALFPIRNPIQFTCQVCGRESKEIAHLCTNCRLLIHSKCAQFLGTIKIRGHGHSLTYTFSLSQVKKHKCEVCYENVDTKNATYYCDDQKCDYIAHLRCAYWIRKESETSDSFDYATHLVEGNDLKEGEKAAPKEIVHLSHPLHKLNLQNEELLDVKRCEGCMQFIVLSPFYGCVECNFSLHIRCTKLPQKVMQPLHHEHLLSLHEVDSNVQSFESWACKRKRGGFNYKCDNRCGERIIFDAQCILIPEVFKHKGHQHRLFLGGFHQPNCNACGQLPYYIQAFECTTCGFRLCIKCATLPLVTRHKYDTHLLYLTYAAEDNSKEYYCQICEEERDEKLWFYYCKNCDFAAHPRCVLGEELVSISYICL
ncbi:uncharacterized protein LOC132178066 [Corylus avellana]|uniref:uncharacterized protein LOC132178066 n=1 Tax=Corylus avellana TaxID=13451 RepID=UPI00286A1CC7|nr:uncharacterized protein LOC132178066 [Corylus avellana]